jgi:hypothetical protein
VSEQFHPTADWPGALPDLAATVDLLSARQSAFDRIVADFPVAARLYSIRAALESAPADQMLRQTMACVVAADCWIARLPCPRSGGREKTWAQYFGMRAGAVKQALSDALTRSTVLERIPVHWIPHEHVSAQLSAVAAGAGFTMERVEMQLIPPIPGGHEWVARECGQAIATLSARGQDGPVAAILHWPDRTAVAIVVKIQGQLKAFGTAFEPDGTALDVAKLSAATLIQAMVPPLSLVQRWTRALRLHWFVWRWVRWSRMLLGANPLASV